MESSQKPRWWHYKEETFSKLISIPKYFIFLVAALYLLTSLIISFSVYASGYYQNFKRYYYTYDLSAPKMDVQVEKENIAMPNNTLTYYTAPRCRWAKYADWPYPSEFSGLLSPYRRKLLYVKTPKTSSSTTAHILQRYTSREGLIVGYPNFAGNEWVFKSESSLHDALMRQRVSGFDALVSHIIYRKQAVDEVLGTGGNTTIERPFRVTSVRNPLNRSWSMYMHGISKSNAAGFAMGARNPLEFAYRLEFDGQLHYAAGYKYGVKPETPKNVDNHYDHIVVSERIEESFLTLAPKLGLRVSDLLFISQKMHGFAEKMTRNDTIDDIVRRKNVLDYQLYDLASTRLNNELRLLPGKITQILRDIPEMMKGVTKVCGMIKPEDNSCFTNDEAYNLTVWEGNQMCVARCIERWAQENIICK